MDKIGIKIFAWDGVQFPVPADWDLATYRYRWRGADLVLEDPFEVRLELEWQARVDKPGFLQGQKRYRRLTESLEKVAARARQVEQMPSDWHVRHYRMPDKRSLFTAFWTGPMETGLAFVRFHVAPEQSDAEAERLFRGLLQGFVWPSGEMSLWRLYDLELLIPECFRLRATSFLAGRKMMLFEYRLRRLFIWQFSLASRIEKNKSLPEFVADFINQAKQLPGIKVEKITPDKLRISKKPIHIFGHYEDIGRCCFRYYLDYYIDRSNDTLAILVFHHRSRQDLNWLKGLRYHAGPV